MLEAAHREPHLAARILRIRSLMARHVKTARVHDHGMYAVSSSVARSGAQARVRPFAHRALLPAMTCTVAIPRWLSAKVVAKAWARATRRWSDDLDRARVDLLRAPRRIGGALLAVAVHLVCAARSGRGQFVPATLLTSPCPSARARCKPGSAIDEPLAAAVGGRRSGHPGDRRLAAAGGVCWLRTARYALTGAPIGTGWRPAAC